MPIQNMVWRSLRCLCNVGWPYRTGLPRKDIDAIKEKFSMMTTGYRQKSSHLWVIEARRRFLRIPCWQSRFECIVRFAEAPYHERKVTLNGPHTVLSPVAYLSGVNIVRDACNHEVVGQYINKVMFDELMETPELAERRAESVCKDVLERSTTRLLITP